MNKHFYLKHEIMAFNDPRVQNMLRQEGGKAYGAYWYIMEKLSLLPDMEGDFMDRFLASVQMLQQILYSD